MEHQSNDNLVWIDMEMSGLDPEMNVILEIATIVTDKELNVLAEGPVIAVSQEPAIFESMDKWNQTHHTKSGLWQKVLTSQTTVLEAQEQTLEFIKQFTKPKENPLCGNSIAQDRLFLMKYMPLIHNHLHYRMIDVSTLKELSKRWYSDSLCPFEKKNLHRALDDIRESILELKYYRDQVFKDQL